MNLARLAAPLMSGRFLRRPDGGLWFPRENVILSGAFICGGVRVPNLITSQGLTYLIDNGGLASGSLNFYMALWGTDVTPLASWTAATFPATAGEIGDPPEGYLESTRPAYHVEAGNVTGSISNNGPGGFFPSEFNIRTASSLAVCGLALLTVSTKLATTGSLICAARFPGAPVSFSNRDIVDSIYEFTVTPT